MTPTPNLTQVFTELSGTLRAQPQVVYVTSDNSAALLCMASLFGLGLLALFLVIAWERKHVLRRG